MVKSKPAPPLELVLAQASIKRNRKGVAGADAGENEEKYSSLSPMHVRTLSDAWEWMPMRARTWFPLWPLPWSTRLRLMAVHPRPRCPATSARSSGPY